MLDLGSHPVAHRFLAAPDQVEYTHPVRAVVCDRCGLVQLVDPVAPEVLYTDYVTLSSWKNQPHVPRLIELIEDKLALPKQSSVLEVGSNDGGFLSALAGAGYSRLLGVEPARDARAAAGRIGVPTVGEYFDVRLGRELVRQGGSFDLFVARQVLEHIAQLEGFRDAMRAVLAPGALVLVEVPNFEFSLLTSDYSAIWEEHVNYFTIDTLSRYLGSAGIRLLHSETARFSGEILIVLGEYVGTEVVEPADGRALAALDQAMAYAGEWPATRDRLADSLSAHRRGGGRIGVYGAGCRSCSLINFAGIAPHIEFAVDDQPEKQGKYMPGSRLAIRPPEALAADGIDLCLLAVNAENEERVIARQAHFCEQGGRFESLHPPSERLHHCLTPVGAT